MANPFYVQPADYSQGLGMLGQAVQGFKQNQQQEEMIANDQALRSEAFRVFKEGTPEERDEFIIKNPEYGKRVMDQIKWKNEATRQNFNDSVREIVANPQATEEILKRRAQFVSSQGGDPSETLAEIEKYKADPEGYLNIVDRIYNVNEPESYKAYKSSLNQKPSNKFQYKDGVVFDPSTGSVTKTEFYNQDDGKAGVEQSTSNMKDFQFYQDLKAKDPEAAEAFAIKSGIIKPTPKKPMSVTTERILNDAQNAAYDAFSSSDSLTALADQYNDSKGELGGGFFGSAAESFKEFVGGEDEVSSLKKNYARLKNSLVIKSLPQGPATDKDIAIFSKGFPGESSDPEYIESFLRGMAKSQYLSGRFNEFKSQYISDKGNTAGLTKAWKEESKKLDGELKEKFTSKPMSIDDLVNKWGG